MARRLTNKELKERMGKIRKLTVYNGPIRDVNFYLRRMDAIRKLACVSE